MDTMNTAPTITIYVRHSADCKYEGDEFSKRCACRKWLRWSQHAERNRKPANTRSWQEAEAVKRELQDQLTGRVVEPTNTAKGIPSAINVFLQDKGVQRIAEDSLAKYARELDRLRSYCDRQGIYSVQGITRELLTGFMATWEKQLCLSPVTQSKTRERLRSFLRYCYEAQWLPRIPALPKIKTDMVETLPLTEVEYGRLLASIPLALPNHPEDSRRRVRGLLLLMRWSGLSIADALLLRRSRFFKDGRGIHRVETCRTKTGTAVSVPVPPEVAEEILTVPNTNPEFLFWSGNGKHKSLLTTFQRRYILPVFKEAGLYDENAHMVSHRLRDTFAVDLLQKGVPMEEVSRALGHASIRTTEQSYAKWAPGRQDRLDTLVMGTWDTTARPANPKRRVGRKRAAA
jgi:integrase/recombinase XerD